MKKPVHDERKADRGVKPKLGRPRVPKKLARGSLLSVRFSDGERKLVEQAAKREEEKLSEYARSALLATILVFNDQFALISSRPANHERARAIARVHLNSSGNAAYLYDFTRSNRVTRLSRGARPDEIAELELTGESMPAPLRRLEAGCVV